MQLKLALETQTDNYLQVEGVGHVGAIRRCLWTPAQRMAILSPTHYMQFYPRTAFIMHEEKSYIVQVSTVANSSRQLLQRLGVEGRVIASFHNIGGNFVRNGYEFLYSRMDYVGTVQDSAQAVQMVAESNTEEDEQHIYMMDANEIDMHDVAAAVAELDELPDWVGGDIKEYFPKENMEVNKAGEIIITLKHGDSKV